MIQKKIYLRENDPDVYLTTYISEVPSIPRDAILVIPGGGYGVVCADREGEPIAFSYMNYGLNAFVLHYSIKEKAVFPRPLCDASLAMAYIRAHAEEFNINPNRVFAVGFSAGGHLAGSLGLMWNLPEVNAEIDIPEGSNRPTGVILGYPVTTSKEYASHRGSFHNILGKKDATDEEYARYSLENHVHAGISAPMFAFHTAKDQIVPVEGTLLLAHEYAREKVTFELHIFPEGLHGLALANRATSHGDPISERANVAKWVEMSIEWMQNL